MGLKRLSQAVVPVSPGDADPNRYVYLTPENTEPSLGLPDGDGYILYSNADGSREFTEIGNLLIEGGGILIDANGRISIDPNVLVNVNVSANVDVTRTGFTRFEYVTPNGQVLLSGTDIYGQDLDFSANDQVIVYVDGFLLQQGVDYNWANGYGNANLTSAVTLQTGTKENSIVSIHRFSPTLFAQGPDGNAAFAGNTDDIPEGSANLWFTNVRARAAFSGSDTIVYDEANGIFSANVEEIVNEDTVLPIIAAANTLVTGNLIPAVGHTYDMGNLSHPWRDLYFTLQSVNFVRPPQIGQPPPTAPTATISVDPDSGKLQITDGTGGPAFTTDEVPEGASNANVYFTNVRAISALTAGQNITIEANGMIVADTAGTFTGNTDLIPEGVANLYFTDARAVDALTNANISIFINDVGYLTTANIYGDEDVAAYINGNITTSNIAEGANLYFTNERALAAISDNLSTSNVSEGSNLYYTNARVESFISQFITTSNIAEGSNLYFTNTRAVSALTAGENIIIYANGMIVSQATFGGALPTLFTSNIVESGDVTTGNVYFTNARAREAINAGFGLDYDNATGTIYVEECGITTDNIAEGTANLFFTNTRSIGALTAGDNIVIESNGLIISSATISALPTLFTSNIVESGDTTTGNVYFSNARARGAFTFGAGLTYNSQTGSLQANVRSVNGQTGIVDLTTANVAEGGANLYFSNDRAIGAFTSGPGILLYPNGLITASDPVQAVFDSISTSNVLEGSNLYFTNVRAITAVKDNISTSNVAEGSNLYYSNNRVNAAVNAFITTSNVKESGSNLYFSNTRARRAWTAGAGINAANLSQGIITVESIDGAATIDYINASNVIETGTTTSGNVFFTNARARAAWTASGGINSANLANGIVSADVRSVAGKTGVVILYTPNVIEQGDTTSGNVFFSNARARGAFTAGAGIDATDLASGIITVSGAQGGISGFTSSNILAGYGIAVTRSQGNATISNDGVVTVGQDTTYGGNSITITREGGNVKLALSSNIYVGGTMHASNIIAETLTVNGKTVLNTTGEIAAHIKASNVIETGTTTTGNVFFSNARAIKAFTAGPGIDAGKLATGIIEATTTLSIGDTDDLPEGSANLYFTDARARSAVVGLDISAFTNDAGYLTPGDPVVIDPTDVFQEIEVEHVGEGHGNVAFNPVNGTITYNKVTNANVRSAFSAGPGITINYATGEIEATATIAISDTDDLPEGTSNLYFTTARVEAVVQDYFAGQGQSASDGVFDNITVLGEIITNGTGGDIKNVNLFSGTAVTANEWYGISTSNVVEGSRLYFNDARAYANTSLINVSTFPNDADYVANAVVRTYFGANGDGLEYDDATGLFSINADFVSAVTSATSTDVQNFELAADASAGDVMLINNDGTISPITEVVTQTDLLASENDPSSLMYLFPASGVNRQYYVATGSPYFSQRPAVSTFGRDNILVTMSIFHDAGAASSGDYGIVVKAAKLAQDGKSLDALGPEYIPVTTGNVGIITLFSTKIHILYDDSSDSLGYERYFLFYYIGDESSRQQVMESVIVDKSTLAITRQNITELPSEATFLDWSNLDLPTTVGADPAASLAGYYFYISDVKQDPHNPSRIWFGGLGTPGTSFTNYWGERQTYVGYFDIASDGSISNIFGKTVENILLFNPEFTNTTTAQETYYKEVRLALDPNNPNILVVLLSGNDGAVWSSGGATTYDRHLSHIYYLELSSINFRMLNDRITGPFDNSSSDNTGFAHDIVWHPLRNNIYALVGYKMLTFTINADNGTLQLSQTQNLATSFGTARLSLGGTSIGTSGWVLNPAKIYYSTNEDYKNNLILVSGTTATNMLGGTYAYSVTLNSETGHYQSGTINQQFNQFGKLLAENPTIDTSGSTTGDGIRPAPIGFNPYTQDDKFYTAQFHSSIASTYAESMGYLTWGTMGGQTSNWDETKFVGILQEAGADGEVKPVATIGTTSLIHSTLNPGDEIYVDVYDGTLGNVETDSSFKIGSALSESNVLIYNRKLGERDGAIQITGVRNIGTGAGSLSYNPYSGLVTFNKVDTASLQQVVLNLIQGTNPIQAASGVITLKIGDNLTVNSGGYLTGVESFNGQDAIDAVLPSLSATNSGTGYGAIAYDDTIGAFTFTKVTDADIRGRFSGSGGITYNSSGGLIAVNVGTGLAVGGDGKLNALAPTAADIYGFFSADNTTTGYGSLSYNQSSGEFTFTKVTQADIVAAVNTNIRVNSLGVGVAATGTAGEIIATNDITAFYSSDERLKTNVSVIDNALVKIDKIRGVSFDWNETAQAMYPDRTEHDVGVIAQEIEAILPEVVVDRDNGFKAVRYEKIIPLLIQAIKELKQEVDELKKNR